MKPIEQYETPKTDAEDSDDWTPGCCLVPSDFARRLEQERAALRDALKELQQAAEDRLTRPPRSMGDSLNQRRRLDEATNNARAVLAATEPAKGDK